MLARVISLSVCGLLAVYLEDQACLSAVARYVISYSTIEYFLSGIGEFEREVDAFYEEEGKRD